MLSLLSVVVVSLVCIHLHSTDGRLYKPLDFKNAVLICPFLTERPTVRLQNSKMEALKLIGIICLVYFTIFSNAATNFCKKADQKLARLTTLVENIDCASQGTSECFYSKIDLSFQARSRDFLSLVL